MTEFNLDEGSEYNKMIFNHYLAMREHVRQHELNQVKPHAKDSHFIRGLELNIRIDHFIDELKDEINHAHLYGDKVRLKTAKAKFRAAWHIRVRIIQLTALQGVPELLARFQKLEKDERASFKKEFGISFPGTEDNVEGLKTDKELWAKELHREAMLDAALTGALQKAIGEKTHSAPLIDLFNALTKAQKDFHTLATSGISPADKTAKKCLSEITKISEQLVAGFKKVGISVELRE